VTRKSAIARNMCITLLFAALAMRALVPTGWMPSANSAFAITLCTGIDTQTVWLGKDGTVHKQDPSKGKTTENQPCAFAGLGMSADVSNDVAFNFVHATATDYIVRAPLEVSVGQGLAAPPPPATGPPFLI
jgi:hypothetical protein